MARFTGAERRAGFWAAAMLLLVSVTPLFAQPVIKQLTPNFLVEDQTIPQEVSVTGTGFVHKSEVVFGEARLKTKFESETLLTAEIPVELLATPGTVNVTVDNGPGTQPSPPVVFTIVGIPTVTSISPDTAVAGSPGFFLTVTGTNFTSASSVVFGANSLGQTTGTATELTVQVPAESILTAGPKSVLVRNPAVPDSNALVFNVTAAPLPRPTLTSLNPTLAIAGSAALPIVVTGTGFVDGAVIVFGGTDLVPTAFGNVTQLSATIPAGLLAAAGPVQVSVRNPDGQASEPKPFTVNEPLSVTYPPTITGVRNTAISAVNASVSGGLAPYRYSLSVVSGTLPAGVAIDQATGVISGTPTQAGTATVRATVVDSGSPQQTATSQDIVITISHPPLQVVTLAPLPGGTAGTTYTTTLTASGGDGGPYTWSLKSGALPSGLLLSEGGVITGTLLEAGVFSIEIQVNDTANTPPATKELSLTIVPVITALKPNFVATETTNFVLNIEGLGFVQTGTTADFGGTPSIGPVEVILGSPAPSTTARWLLPDSALTTQKTVSVTVTVNGATSNALPFRVGDTTITITNESNLGTRTAGTPFNADLDATGGNGSYTWSVAAGSTLPAGLSLNAATGVLNGILSAAGNFSFTIHVADNADPGQASGQKTFNLVVQDFLVSTTSLPQARVGIAYSAPLTLAGGPTAPPADYEWTLVSGIASLPGGITFNAGTGAFAGTPDPIGVPSRNFTLQVSAKHTPTGLVTPTRTLQLTVAGGGLDISTASLPLGVVNQPYGPTATGVTITPVNGTAPYRFEVDGTQAAKLATAGFRVETVNDDNRQAWNVRISGTPTMAGSFPLELTLRDAGNTQVSRTLTIQVLANALSIQPETLPAAIANIGYSQQLTLIGASVEEPSVTWSMVGNVPGLSLDASTGMLSGQFTTVGSRTFSVQAATALREVTRVYTLTIGGPRPVISTTTLPPAQVGQDYDQHVTATGGTPGYTWQLSAGALPQGLNFDTVSNPGAARIVGVPSSTAQSQTFTLTVRDSLGQTASHEFTIAVTSTPIPAVTIESFSNPVPAEQKDVVVRLAQAYPVELKGTATLTFTPNVPNNVGDPKLLFLNGRRSADFTIPANTMQAVFDGVPVQRVQTGTVAGTAKVQVAITGGPTTSQEFTIARSAPFLQDSLTLQTTASGFNVVVTGYSTPRDLTSARVTFTPTAGTNLQTTELNIPLTASSATWFDSTPGKDNGSAFKLSIPFNVQNGSNAVASVTVTLTNSVGASNSRTRTF